MASDASSKHSETVRARNDADTQANFRRRCQNAVQQVVVSRLEEIAARGGRDAAEAKKLLKQYGPAIARAMKERLP